jgi:hypothetical protein
VSESESLGTCERGCHGSIVRWLVGRLFDTWESSESLLKLFSLSRSSLAIELERGDPGEEHSCECAGECTGDVMVLLESLQCEYTVGYINTLRSGEQ